jgi:hypothetical protein
MKKKQVTLSTRYNQAAKINIENCIKSCKRMNSGIEILRKDNLAWKAFMLANRAMFMQRVHLKFQQDLSDKDRYPYDIEIEKGLASLDYGDKKDNYFWRPFQIAFLLMSIRSIVQDDSDERSLVDLIWFPTGGGKSLIYQMGALNGICKTLKTHITYIKPHGALYNDMMKDKVIFEAIAQAVSSYDKSIKLMILSSLNNEEYKKIASKYDVKLLYEVFADKPDGA